MSELKYLNTYLSETFTDRPSSPLLSFTHLRVCPDIKVLELVDVRHTLAGRLHLMNDD